MTMWPFNCRANSSSKSDKLPTLYDFLYVDTKRISRLITQMDDRGIKQGIKQQVKAQAEIAFDVGQLVPGLRVGANSARETETLYDGSWGLSVAFLRSLDGYCFNDPSDWDYGALVQFTGTIAFHDFPYALRMLRVPEIESEVSKFGFPLSSKALNPTAGEVSPVWDLLIVKMHNALAKTWSTVNIDFTTASTGDLALKCGADEGCTWTITGFVDAVPDSGTKRQTHTDQFDVFANEVRHKFGRPSSYFGVTPLTIHRFLKTKPNTNPSITTAAANG